MARVKRGVIARARLKIWKQAKGYYGAFSRMPRCLQAIIKADPVSYRDRRQRKRRFRQLCGLRVSTRHTIRTVFLTANSSMA